MANQLNPKTILNSLPSPLQTLYINICLSLLRTHPEMEVQRYFHHPLISLIPSTSQLPQAPPPLSATSTSCSACGAWRRRRSAGAFSCRGGGSAGRRRWSWRRCRWRSHGLCGHFWMGDWRLDGQGWVGAWMMLVFWEVLNDKRQLGCWLFGVVGMDRILAKGTELTALWSH